MTKYRGTLTLTANTPSTNVAENTPFRQMVKGEMLSCSAICLTGVAADAEVPPVNATLQIGRTVLFSGPINQIFNEDGGAGSWGRNGVMEVDRLFMGPVPVNGTLNLTFQSDEGDAVLWELGGEVLS